MWHRRSLLLLGLLAALTLSARAADDSSPEERLQAKGLRKINQYFSLPEEAEVTKNFHSLDSLYKKTTDARQKLAAADKKVEEKKNYVLDCLQKQRELNAQLATARSAETHNKLAAMFNELTSRIVILEKSDKEEKDATAARAAASSAAEQYVEQLMKLRRQYDDIEEKYEKLGDDPEVVRAIDEYDKDNPKPAKLGPTGSFALLDRNLKKLESKVLSETIDLRRGAGNLWHVNVMLNGKRSQEFAIDTGASIISLPYEVAVAAGMTPSENDPTGRFSLADGHVVEAKRVFASTVRLGRFTIEHVECAVMPADLPRAEPLLGLSFFKHFTYKIDSAKGKLYMSQIESSDSGLAGKGSAGKGSRRTAVRGDRHGSRPAGERPVAESPAPGEKHGLDDEPGQARPATPPQTKPSLSDQIVQLIKPSDEPSQEEGLTLQPPGCEVLKFRPCKHGPAESLGKRFGSPDEIVKLQLTRVDGGQQKTLAWKLWTWGKVRILVDEAGKTQYYAIGKE